MAILLITHDLGVVSELAHRVLVIYTGKLLESTSISDLYNNPKHPYTKGLLNSATKLGTGRGKPLKGIPGSVPDLLNLPSGCTFHPRCDIGDDGCTIKFPDVMKVSTDHSCSCYKVDYEKS